MPHFKSGDDIDINMTLSISESSLGLLQLLETSDNRDRRRSGKEVSSKNVESVYVGINGIGEKGGRSNPRNIKCLQGTNVILLESN